VLFRKRNRPRKRHRIRKLRLLALLALLGVLGLSAFTAGLMKALAAQVPVFDPAAQPIPQQNTYIYASDGHTILAVLRGDQARVLVSSEQVAPLVKQAIVAIEDKRFYEHRGVDVHAIARALWSDVTGGPVEGGSTITQQLVKNTINGSAPTVQRKLKEAMLAWRLEQKWTKDQILTAYLNTIFFGNGAYGVEEACRVYFGHSSASATAAEAAMLAGIPENPTLYDPVAHPTATRERRNLVLRQMFLQHYLDYPTYRDAIHAPMPDPEKVHLQATQTTAAPYFANYVTNQLVSSPRFGKSIYGGGYRIRTTIDLGLQRLAREAIAKELPPSIGPDAALVAIDVHTGQVVAMVGGRNYHRSQFNLAAQGERQPGSSFKPFVLAAALRDGVAPSTTFVSHPVVIDADGRTWSVSNFEDENLGTLDLSHAIAFSDNTVFAQLTDAIGPASVVGAAQAMGITTPLHSYFSIGLGAEPATPLEMARAYATLANGGFRLDSSLFGDQPNVVASVSSPQKSSPGEFTTTENTTKPIELSWLTNGNAAIEDQMLRGVIQYGTGKAAQLPGWDVAGKTGTTENYGDAWFVGFTPDLVTAVWVGYPNKLIPMTTEYHGHTVEGGTFPALIWKAFMEKALPKFVASRQYVRSSLPSASVPYASPYAVVYRNGKLELSDGSCSGATTMQFFSGSAPTARADCATGAQALAATPSGSAG